MKQSQVTVVDLATELRRLAQGVVREARREMDLACLSNLAAIRSLAQLLTDTLAGEITLTKQPAQLEEPRQNSIGFSASRTHGPEDVG